MHTKTNCNMYAALSALENPHLEALQSDVMWDGVRGWLDEMKKVVRRRVYEEGRDWSTSERLGLVNNGHGNDAPSDSNSDPYMTDWRPQGGSDVSVTLSARTQGFPLGANRCLGQAVFAFNIVERTTAAASDHPNIERHHRVEIPTVASRVPPSDRDPAKAAQRNRFKRLKTPLLTCARH